MDLRDDRHSRPGNHQPQADTGSRSRSITLNLIKNKIRRLQSSSSKLVSSSVEETGKVDRLGPLGLNLLHEPSDPRIDFIFIHGLGGGSRKTWSYSADQGPFWPKDWLPNEPGFKHVRLHSYGYSSDWQSSKESRLTVHDFGQALLADIHNSPNLRKNGTTPIVLVAHSMGGLVAKKAYLIATRDPTYRSTGDRIHSIYFLGTPHRGADSARLAKLLLTFTWYGPKAFLGELIPGSGTLDVINDEFRHVCGRLNLWSFYEGEQTRIGTASSFVVDKESAVLGLPGECTRYLQADHRHICKFQNPEDPNYIIVQRAFLSTIQEIESSTMLQPRGEYRAQMKQITAFLGIEERPEAELLALNDKQHSGSCVWLTDDSIFQDWVDGPVDRVDLDTRSIPFSHTPSRILWLKGRPGTGKSVAAGHAIRYLQAGNLDCHFYFFKHDEKEKSTAARLLRSLAFQMAESCLDVRHAIVAMIDDDEKLNKEDHHMIWNRLFLGRIFKTESLPRQFWVVDALDECSSKWLATLVTMFSQLDLCLPIRIMITSRPGSQLERLWAQAKTPLFEITSGQDGSMRDIELYLRDKCLHMGTSPAYQDLVSEILSKSNGIFLWASLTISRIQETYSLEDMQVILRETPLEMNDYYRRITWSISDSSSADLAKCILKWVTCSPKILSVQELEEATRLDIGRTLTVSPRQLEAMCGHLISIDNRQRVQLTHQTISTFLTDQDSVLRIDKLMSHARVAEVCLQLFCGEDFSPPLRASVRHLDGMPKETRSPLSDYAVVNFSYHMVHSSPTVDGPLVLLANFLQTNILTWVERVARRKDLTVLHQTTRRLKGYLTRRAKCTSSLESEVRTAEAWTLDISHLLAAFGSNLLVSPSSIHFLVPQLCPRNSIIHRQFAKRKRVKLIGYTDQDWDDRIACHIFPEDACSIASCSRLIGVGLGNGEIRLLQSSTFAPVSTLVHGGKVRLLAFNQNGAFLASCSTREVRLWDVGRSSSTAGEVLWSAVLDFVPTDVAFHPNGDILMLTNAKNSSIVTIKLSDGKRGQDKLLWELSDSDSDENEQAMCGSPAELIRLEPHHKLAAVSYRNAQVAIWDLDLDEKVGVFAKEGFEDVYCLPPALDMLFNPVLELKLLAISYKDGDVVTCDPWSLEQVCRYDLQRANIDKLAATSDGRVLAGGDDLGTIHLFLFKTLHPIYRIKRPEEQWHIRDIIFTYDNLRFLDIREQCCNVWEPIGLLLNERGDDSSSEPYSEELVSRMPSSASAHLFQWGEAITAMVSTLDGKILFVGRKDGSIDACNVSTGAVIEKLQFHGPFTEILHLDWSDEESILLSSDTTNRCLITRIAFTGTSSLQHTATGEHRSSSCPSQTFLSPDGKRFLVVTHSAVVILGSNGEVMSGFQSASDARWVNHPSDPNRLLRFHNQVLSLHNWSTGEEISSMPIDYGPNINRTNLESPTVWVSRKGSSYLACQMASTEPESGAFLTVLDLSLICGSVRTVMLLSPLTPIPNVKRVLGILRSSLFFLDTGGWICSIGLKSINSASSYTRHFFIPTTWQTGVDPIISIVSKSTVAFGRGEQLILFQGFLEFEDKVVFNEENNLAEQTIKLGLSKSHSWGVDML